MTRFLIIFLVCLFVYPVLAETEVQCELTESSPTSIQYDYERDGWEGMEAIFQPQILAYLNSGTAISELELILEQVTEYPKTFAEVIEADVTADNQADVLVSLSFSWGGTYEAYLMLYSCDGNSFFHRDTVSFGGWDAGEAVEILYAIDLNNNQFRDILLSIFEIVGQKYHETLKIIEWDGDSLEETFSLGPEYGGYSLQLLFDTENPARPLFGIGDAYAYEEETASAFIEYSYIRPSRRLYQWDGTEYGFLCRHFTDEAQLYPTVLHSAEAYRSCDNYEMASIYYRQILSSNMSFEDERWYAQAFIIYPEAISEEERTDYTFQLEAAYHRAFAAYRLLQIAIYESDTDGIETQLTWLSANYNIGDHGYVYAAMAFALWEDFQTSHDLEMACDAAARAFDEAYTNGDDPGIDYQDELNGEDVFHYGFYFTSGRPYAADPDNLFAVPDSIDGMVSTPICL